MVLYGLVDVNSERAEQVYFLHSRYSNPNWFLYEREGSHPHMENLRTALMFEKNKINVNGTEISIDYEIRMAISKILEWETMKIKDYKWNCQEAGNTIISINMYLNKKAEVPAIWDYIN